MYVKGYDFIFSLWLLILSFTAFCEGNVPQDDFYFLEFED